MQFSPIKYLYSLRLKHSLKIPESYFYNLTEMTSKSVSKKLVKDFRMSENVIDDLIQYKSKLYFDNINKFQVF